MKVCIKTRSPSTSLPSITVKWPIGFCRVSMFLKSAVKQNNLMPLEIKDSALFKISFTLMKIDSFR